MQHSEKSSAIIAGVAEKLKSSHITLGEFLDLLGDRSFGLVILVFCLPNALPAPGIPGVSTVTGIPIMFFAAQLILGKKALWVPNYLREKKLASEGLRKVLEKSVKSLIFLEKFLKPRLIVKSAIGEKIVGGAIFLMAFLMALPIIFGNFPPAVAIIILALGLMEKDGLAMILGLGAAIAAAIFVGTIVSGLALGVKSLFNFLM